MKRLVAQLALLAIAVLALSPTHAEPSSGADLPLSFEASIGGMLGPSAQVVLKENTIFYTPYEGGYKAHRTVKIVPSVPDWIEFRAALDHIGVWKWKPSYINNGVYDGTQWSLTISYPDHTLTTKGDNAYPNNLGRKAKEPEYTKAFSAYLAAVKKLTHGKDFD